MLSPGLAWDRTTGAHRGRVYLVYTLEEKNESDDTNIYVRYSDDDGRPWSAPKRVNDDTGTNSQFMSKIALDPTTGEVAVVWYDARNDLGNRRRGRHGRCPERRRAVLGRVHEQRDDLHAERPDQRRDLELARLG